MALPAQTLYRYYKARFHSEIVFTHLTKTRGLTAGMRRDHIADFDRSLGHEAPINQPLDQVPLLCKRCALSPGVDPRPTGLDGGQQSCSRGLTSHWSVSLSHLGC